MVEWGGGWVVGGWVVVMMSKRVSGRMGEFFLTLIHCFSWLDRMSGYLIRGYEGIHCTYTESIIIIIIITTTTATTDDDWCFTATFVHMVG